MAFGVSYIDYRFKGGVDLVDVLERLSDYGDLEAEGPTGVRFEPDSEDWPVTYFRGDGSIHVLTRGLDLGDVVAYVHALSRVVGADIVEESRTH